MHLCQNESGGSRNSWITRTLLHLLGSDSLWVAVFSGFRMLSCACRVLLLLSSWWRVRSVCLCEQFRKHSSSPKIAEAEGVGDEMPSGHGAPECRKKRNQSRSLHLKTSKMGKVSVQSLSGSLWSHFLLGLDCCWLSEVNDRTGKTLLGHLCSVS